MTAITSEVKMALKEMLENEKMITKLSETLKKYKARNDILQKSVEGHMRKNEIKAINLPGGSKLQTYTRKQRTSCSKEWISNRLQNYCQTHQLNYDELYDFIYNPAHRPQVEKKSIKKVKPRVKKE
jgi:hypothetical protein